MKILRILMLLLFMLTTPVIASAGDLKLIYAGGNVVDLDLKMDGMMGLKYTLFRNGIPICDRFRPSGEATNMYFSDFVYSEGVVTYKLERYRLVDDRYYDESPELVVDTRLYQGTIDNSQEALAAFDRLPIVWVNDSFRVGNVQVTGGTLEIDRANIVFEQPEFEVAAINIQGPAQVIVENSVFEATSSGYGTFRLKQIVDPPDISVQNSTFKGVLLELWACRNVIVQGNTVTNSGIQIYDIPSAIDGLQGQNVIDDNHTPFVRMVDQRYGDSQRDNNNQIENNVIDEYIEVLYSNGNQIDSNKGGRILVTGARNLITHNDVSHISTTGFQNSILQNLVQRFDAKNESHLIFVAGEYSDLVQDAGFENLISENQLSTYGPNSSCTTSGIRVVADGSIVDSNIIIGNNFGLDAFRNGPIGIELNADHCLVKKNTVVRFSSKGIKISGTNNKISLNTVNNCLDTGLYVGSTSSTMYFNTVNWGKYGLRANGIDNTIRDNIFTKQSYRAIELGGNDNLFYNNFIGPGPTYSAKDISNPSGLANRWNTETAETNSNIIGGPSIGGNFWSKYGGADLNEDGFGDIPFVIPHEEGLEVMDNFPLVPKGWPGVFQITPSAIDLEGVEVGDVSSVKTLTITNISAGPAQVGLVYLDGPESHGFSIVGNQASGVTLAPNASTTFDVQFWPLDTGNQSVQIRLSNAPGLQIPVSAVGFNPTMGDFNHDGRVNMMDLSIILQVLTGQEPARLEQPMDTNGDGVVEFSDAVNVLNIIRQEQQP